MFCLWQPYHMILSEGFDFEDLINADFEVSEQ